VLSPDDALPEKGLSWWLFGIRRSEIVDPLNARRESFVAVEAAGVALLPSGLILM